jgi:hypothetical protein
MTVSIAEYLGIRTDQDVFDITPVVFGNGTVDFCPFAYGKECSKTKIKNQPVCSVRKMVNGESKLWIVCEDRLCCTDKNRRLVDYQKYILASIAQKCFKKPFLRDQVMVKREEGITVLAGIAGRNYKADFIMTIENGRHSYPGPDKFILEMQGGGETSQTGMITEHLKSWKSMVSPTNAFLRQPIQGPGTIETNAWRRQQEQFIVKGNVAMNTWKGYGIVFCIGSLLYEYLDSKITFSRLPNLTNSNWTLAVLPMVEIPVQNNQYKGFIPLTVDAQRGLFTNYLTFVQAIINQGEPSPNAFRGEFLRLDDTLINLP